MSDLIQMAPRLPRLKPHQCSSKRGFKMWILITSPHTVLGCLQTADSLPQSHSKSRHQSSVSHHMTLYHSPWARWITPYTFFRVFSTQIQTTITGSSHRLLPNWAAQTWTSIHSWQLSATQVFKFLAMWGPQTSHRQLSLWHRIRHYARAPHIRWPIPIWRTSVLFRRCPRCRIWTNGFTLSRPFSSL